LGRDDLAEPDADRGKGEIIQPRHRRAAGITEMAINEAPFFPSQQTVETEEQGHFRQPLGPQTQNQSLDLGKIDVGAKEQVEEEYSPESGRRDGADERPAAHARPLSSLRSRARWRRGSASCPVDRISSRYSAPHAVQEYRRETNSTRSAA